MSSPDIETEPGLPERREELFASKQPFIAGRLVELDEANPPVDMDYINEVVGGFGSSKIAWPHVTVLTRKDTSKVHKRQGDSADWLGTRDAIESAIDELDVPEARYCHTGEADVFGNRDANYFVGFHLDGAGKKIVKRERSKLLRLLGHEDPYKGHVGHVSLARTDDPLYARYVANCINTALTRPLSITMSDLQLSQPAIFSVRRSTMQGLPTESGLSARLGQSYGRSVVTTDDHGHDLITPGEGEQVLGRRRRFDELRNPLGAVIGSLASPEVARIDGIEIFEAKKNGKELDILALTLDDKYASSARDARKRLSESMGVELPDDLAASRMSIAAIRDKKITPRVEKLVSRLIPRGRQIFLAGAVLRVYQSPRDYIV